MVSPKFDGPVLGLIGSPRRGGNTDLLVTAALQAAAAAGAQTEAVYVADLRIAECDGCHACWAGRPCRHGDDMNRLYDRLGAARAIIFGTPVYWYGPTGLMKLLLDRLVYFNCEANRPLLRGKPAALMVPFEEQDPAASDLLLAMFRKSLDYLEMPLLAAVTVPGVTRKGEVAFREQYLNEARALGRMLAQYDVQAPLAP